jgi:hypothetical protein
MNICKYRATVQNGILNKAIIIPQSFRNSKNPPEVVPETRLRKESKSESTFLCTEIYCVY